MPDGLIDLPESPGNTQKIEFVQSIEPVDSLDAACKAHDLCFEQNQHDDYSCDSAFMSTLQEVKWSLSDRRCMKLASQMNSAFYAKTNRKGEQPFAPLRMLAGVATAPALVGFDRPEDYPAEGSCGAEENYRHISAAFLLEEFENRCVTPVHQKSHEWRKNYVSENPVCAAPPYDLASDVPEEAFQRIEALWAREHCLAGLRYNYSWPYPYTRANWPNCRDYVNTSAGQRALLNTPWHQYIEE